MDITRWLVLKSDWLYSLQPKVEKLYTVSKNKTESWLWLSSWTPYCQIQTEIEESGKTTIQVWPKSNPLWLSSGSENRYKGLDPIDRVPDELWMEVHDIVEETGIKTIPMEKKCKRLRKAVWGGLTYSCEKKRCKRQRRKSDRLRVVSSDRFQFQSENFSNLWYM